MYDNYGAEIRPGQLRYLLGMVINGFDSRHFNYLLLDPADTEKWNVCIIPIDADYSLRAWCCRFWIEDVKRTVLIVDA